MNVEHITITFTCTKCGHKRRERIEEDEVLYLDTIIKYRDQTCRGCIKPTMISVHSMDCIITEDLLHAGSVPMECLNCKTVWYEPTAKIGAETYFQFMINIEALTRCPSCNRLEAQLIEI